MTMDTAQDRALLHLGQALRDRGYHFITPTPLTHERVNQRPENALADDLHGVFGWSRPFQHELLPGPLFSLMDQAQVLEACGSRWRSKVRLSSLDGQLFLHSAFPTTASDAVFFGPDTYRFANAIRCHLNQHTGMIRRAVDIGCGSGAGAILTALARPQAEVLAVDINPEALRLTHINAALAGADNLRALHSDLLSAVDGEFDLILANLPYLVDADQRAYRHGGGPWAPGCRWRSSMRRCSAWRRVERCCCIPAWRCWTTRTRSSRRCADACRAAPSAGPIASWTRTCSAKSYSVAPTSNATASPPWCWK